MPDPDRALGAGLPGRLWHDVGVGAAFDDARDAVAEPLAELEQRGLAAGVFHGVVCSSAPMASSSSAPNSSAMPVTESRWPM